MSDKNEKEIVFVSVVFLWRPVAAEIKWSRNILRWTFHFHSKQQYSHHFDTQVVVKWLIFFAAPRLSRSGPPSAFVTKRYPITFWKCSMLFCQALIQTPFWIVVIFVHLFICAPVSRALAGPDVRSPLSKRFISKLKNWESDLKPFLFVVSLDILAQNYTPVLCSLHLNLCNLPSFSPPRSRPADVVTAEAEQVVKILVLYVKLEPLVIIFPVCFCQKRRVSITWNYWVCFFFFFGDASPNLRLSCGIVCSFYFCEIIKEL